MTVVRAIVGVLITLSYLFLKPALLNCGHKGGYDCLKELPENSFALLQHLEGQQKFEKFKYLEFDVRETKDNELVVFHDLFVHRMLPNRGYNKELYKELSSPIYEGEPNQLSKKPLFFWKISDLTLSQLQRLSLEGREPVPTGPDGINLYQVPTLQEYIDSLRGKLTKPIVFDIKSLNTTTGRKKFVDAVEKYTSSINGNSPGYTRYDAFPYQQVSVINLTGLKNVFGKPESYCQKLKNADVQIYRGWTHDSICDFFYTKKYDSVWHKIKDAAVRIPQQLAVKHNIKVIESELCPVNHYAPRLVHLDPMNVHKSENLPCTPISDTEKALKSLQVINKDKLIVFVHGRGQHPKKGEEIITELAAKHDAAVVMFDWDSWICRNNCEKLIKSYSSKRPYGNAVAAAPMLADFLEKLRLFKLDNPELKISMLVHSMGNIVFSEMIKKELEQIRGNEIFIENLILNSPDIEREHHQHWLKDVKFAEDTFVTMTRDDFVLGAVELMLYQPRLGQGFDASAPQESFASNALYLDFSKISGSHRKYDNRRFRTFFDLAFGDHSWRQCLQDENNDIDMDSFNYKCVQSEAN